MFKFIRSNKKVYEILAPEIIDIIGKKYNLYISPESAEWIVRMVIWKTEELANQALDQRKDFLDAALDKYFTTTKLPSNDVRRHSCYYFAKYLQKHYKFYSFRRKLFVLKQSFWKILRAGAKRYETKN